VEANETGLLMFHLNLQ